MKQLLWIMPCLIFFLGCSSLDKQTSYNIERDITFKTIGETKLMGDLYRPDKKGPLPLVIVIHGGGWSARSGDMVSICKDLAEQGFVAFNITYRLAPQDRYPAAVEDVKAALEFIKSKSEAYSIDSSRIYTWGYSAGAHLALLLGLDDHSGISGIVAGAAPAYFDEYPESPLIYDFLGKSFKEDPKLWQAASPITHVNANSPPVFLYHGEWDKLVGINQMYLLKAKLEEFKVPVETNAIAYNGHIGVYLFSQSAVDNGIRFLQKLESNHSDKN